MVSKISNEIVARIIKEQELVIGPLAWEQAGKVTGLRVDIKTKEITIEGNTKEVLEKLVAQYEKLFGQASREVCREAVKPLLSQVPQDEIPSILQ